MSRRESRLPPVSLLTIGGVNQRVRDVELPLHEYSNVDGVFPEFAGLQSRLWGKRLLQKYDEAVYGIHQFWTPMGYGGGIYQFDGQIDYGQWLTPTSNFDLNIPPIGYDGGGMTLDEFGLPYGQGLGLGGDNTCVISFLNGGTDHSACLPPPAPADTPDDNNGGPAGQGRKCRWVVGGVDQEIAMPAPQDTFFGINNPAPTQTAAGPTPYPIFPDQIPTRPSSYSAGSGPFGNIWFATCQSFCYKTNLGFGNWRDTQGNSSQNTTGRLDLSAYIDPEDPPVGIEIKVRHNPGPTPPFEFIWVPFNPDMSDPANIQIDVWDFVVLGYQKYAHPLGGGFIYEDFITLEGLRFKRNGRVCS